MDILNPKVTVLMPVYNCELYIKEAIDSILNQTFTDFEFLIIDDASTDKTVSIVKEYNDCRIELIEKPVNTGYTNSLNYGLKVAKGEYIARMDGDDISLPNRFEKQIAFLDANPEVVLCGTAVKVIDSDRVIRYPEFNDYIKLEFLSQNCIVHPSVMIRKSILDFYSISYDTNKEPAEDYNLWVKLLNYGNLYNIQEVLLYYRVHSSQVSQKRFNLQVESSIETQLELLDFIHNGKDESLSSLLNKIFRNNKYSYKDIMFFNQLKKDLLLANKSEFFEPNGFEKYLIQTEYKIINSYFIKRDNFNPNIFFQFIACKHKLMSKMSFRTQMKIFLKSILFWNVKKT
ncbi:glycosyltransferase family 2 protein [Flavobacterium polysaccharolyticum]|uniref:Glycosyltransferase n=1 Tax=Flavobacterium polysaccharolyticum TaxID=3133148 RepID=A0ABU9NLW9_9FLAO